jgi:16S rRNA (guanine1516-N2)-methyltransferase
MTGLLLDWSDGGYALIDQSGRQRPLRIDFASTRLHHRRSRGGTELLAKAAAVSGGMRVLDCTAGLGTDSFVLASRGCHVDMVERSHTLYLMLEDALVRARKDEGVKAIVERMSLMRGDACYVMDRLTYVPDVVIIDPMFPSRRKHAEVRGELQFLQRLLGKQEDAVALVRCAIATGCKRVVLKRPLVGGHDPSLQPTFSVKGKASRFDVFIQPADGLQPG